MQQIEQPSPPRTMDPGTSAGSDQKLEEGTEAELKAQALPETRTAGLFSDEEGNLKIVKHVVKMPCCSCCSVLIICLLMTVLLGVIVVQEGNFITDNGHDYDFSDIRSKDYNAFRLAREYAKEKREETEKTGVVEPRQSEVLDSLQWIYEGETDAGVFTTKGLIDIKEADDILLKHADWNKYCVLEHTNRDGSPKPESEVTCAKPMSSINIFYPDSWDSALAQSVMDRLKVDANMELYNSVAPCLHTLGGGNSTGSTNTGDDQSEFCESIIQGVASEDVAMVQQLNTDIGSITSKWTGNGELVNDPKEVALFCAYLKLLPTQAFLVDFYFDKNFNVKNPVSMFSRSLLKFGAPLDGFQRMEEDQTDQEDLLKDWIMDNLFDDIKDAATKSNSEETNTYYFMGALVFDIFIATLVQDALKAIASVLLVFLYLWYMLGSLFLACVGMGEILLSLPCAWFLFRGIFQIGYFSPLNSLCLFIVAAIGADDIFVFMDAYKQSAHQGPAVNRNLVTRMSWVWRKSGTAMAITSATTCMAFLATLFTPIASTQAFGIFAALVILWDFVLVMTLFCTAVVIYHNRFERTPAWAWLIPAIVYLTKLEPTKTSEQFLADDHPVQYSMTLLSNEFPASSEDTGLPIYFVWGVDTHDLSGVNRLIDPTYEGKTVLKDDFEFSPQCQLKLTEVCNDLEFTRTENRTALLKQAGGFSIVGCVMRSFEDFAAAEGYTAGSADGTVPLENVNAAVKAYVANPPAGYEDIADIVENFGWDGEKLKFVSIEVESQVLNGLQRSNLAEEITRAEYDDFILLAEYLNGIVGNACGARGVLMTDLDQKFIFMNNQQLYRKSAVQGALIGVTLAFAVLIVATRSPQLAALSTLSIICTIMSVIGAVTMLGWTLGTVEAILIAITAGFSVDYVVHLAHAFAHGHGNTEERVRHAFGEMGTPVLSGMITSVLASIPLFTCDILFFAKFGTFLCLTILCSWVFANFGFMGLLSTVGPYFVKEGEKKPQQPARQQQPDPAAEDKVQTTGHMFGQGVFAMNNPVEGR